MQYVKIQWILYRFKNIHSDLILPQNPQCALQMRSSQNILTRWVCQQGEGWGLTQVLLGWPRESVGGQRQKVTFLRWGWCFNEQIKAFLDTFKMHAVPFLSCFQAGFFSCGTATISLVEILHGKYKNMTSDSLLPDNWIFRASHRDATHGILELLSCSHSRWSS